MVFVGVEIRQNTIAARAAAYQEIGFSTADLWRPSATDPAVAALRLLAHDSSRWSEIDDVGWWQLRSIMAVGLRTWETLFLQVQEGLLPETAMKRFGWGADPHLYWPYFDRFWPDLRNLMDEEFAAYIEAQIDASR